MVASAHKRFAHLYDFASLIATGIAGSVSQGAVRLSNYYNSAFSSSSYSSNAQTFNISFMDGSSIVCARYHDRVMLVGDTTGNELLTLDK